MWLVHVCDCSLLMHCMVATYRKLLQAAGAGHLGMIMHLHVRLT